MERDYLIKMIMMECPLCDKEHEIQERRRISHTTIKNEVVEYEEIYYLCRDADESENEFVPSKLNNENLMNARNAYRLKKGLLTSREIVNIREQYGLSQSDLSNMLGWGEVTISRYESKAIQDQAYDNILRIIKDNPLKALEYLEKYRTKFSNSKFLMIREKIIQNLDVFGKGFLKRQVLESEYVNYLEPSDFNGNKSLDIDKLECIISYFAKRVNNLYKVKLMKMLWYADSLCFKINKVALTGLVYFHDNMGALPKGHYKILDLENVIVDKEEDYENTRHHILPNEKMNISILDATEMDILDQVVHKFRNFNTNEIVEYMHNERAYLETLDGKEIPFSLAKYIRDF